MINEYCHPTRSFSPCPQFKQLESNNTWRTRDTNNGEWFTSQYNGGSLGVKFAYGRGSSERAWADWDWHTNNKSITRLDLASVRALSDARTEQRRGLLVELAPNRSQSLKAA